MGEEQPKTTVNTLGPMFRSLQPKIMSPTRPSQQPDDRSSLGTTHHMPDAPTKTTVTRGRNHPVFSICTRSLSSGDVPIAWV